MKRPSGDQTGLEMTELTPSTRRTGAPPSTGTLKSGCALPSLRGDGDPLPVRGPGWRAADFERLRDRDARPCRPRPSGEGAHVPHREPRSRSGSRRARWPAPTATAPSLPFHSSVSEPSLSFQSPSAAPWRQIQEVVGPETRRGGAHGRQLEAAHAGLVDDVIRDRHRPEVADGIRHGRDETPAVGAGGDRDVLLEAGADRDAESAGRRPWRRGRSRSRPLAWRCRSACGRRANAG